MAIRVLVLGFAFCRMIYSCDSSEDFSFSWLAKLEMALLKRVLGLL